jgi:NADPH:quinone reductase-like Zn-dependent oxidoreductase
VPLTPHQVCDVDYGPAFAPGAGFADTPVGSPGSGRNCVRLPDGADFDEAAALGCRFMTIFAAVAVRGSIGPGARTLSIDFVPRSAMGR